MIPISFSDKVILYKNNHFYLFSSTADFGDYSKEYVVMKSAPRVGVIIEKNSSILLVKQYRYVINDYSWELPSGGVGSGESLEEAAKRECREEAGIICNKLSHVFEFVLGADIIDSPAHIFKCTEFDDIGDFDRKEISEIQWVPYQNCMNMIFSREIKDVYTIIGLFAFGRSNS